MKVARVNARRQPILSSPGGVGGGTALPALDDLTDVDTSGVVDGDTIVFDSGSSTWIPGTGSGSTTEGGGFDVTPPLSNALPPWVKPTGTGVITADAQGRLNIDTGTTYKSFPGMTFLEGRLHLVYRDGTAHNSSGGVAKYRTSDDLGRTWSSATTLVTPTAGDDIRDPAIVALSSGRLLCVYDVESPWNGGASAVSARAIYSDNRGLTWSSPYAIPATFSGEEAVTSQPVELPNGTILVPMFGDNGGNAFSVVLSSTDNGATFGGQVTIATSGSREYVEPQIRHMASGNLVCLMRSDTNAHTWRAVSTDNGATWGAAADVLTASSRPDFVEFFPGALLFFGRTDNTNFYARWAVSWDEGATWTALQNVDGSTDVWEYGAPVVLTPGYIAVAYSLQNSSSDADLYLRYYHDGYGTDPLGNIAGLTVTPGATFATPAIVLGTAAAAGAASTVIRSDSTIVAFDATVPVTQAFSDAAATGSAAVAARRDHRHGMPASPSVSGGTLVIASSHSTPLIFGDLVQTSAGDDLIYTSS